MQPGILFSAGLSIEEVFSCLEMSCNKNPGNDTDDVLSSFVHCKSIASLLFVRHRVSHLRLPKEM